MKTYQRSLRSLSVLLSLVSLIAAVSVVSCSSTESRLLGKWKEKGGTEVLEFFKDGRLSTTDKGMSYAGSWTTLDDGRINIEMSVLGTTYVATATMAGNTLKLEMAGKSVELERSQ